MKRRDPARGVGAVVDRALAAFLLEHPAALDYVALTPECLWTACGRGAARRYTDAPAALALADALAERYPVVLHGSGLSIGSATPLDEEHLAQVARVASRYGAARYGERLGFCRVPTAGGHDRDIGLCMPMPCDASVLDWLAPRVWRAGQAAGVPLLLENGVHRTPYTAEDMSEPQFLNRLAAAAGCGVLLNLQHLCSDRRDHGWAPQDYLAQLDLGLVREIRVAVDAAAERPAEAPRAWLRELVPRCPALEGVTLACGAPAAGASTHALREALDALTDVWVLRAMEARDAGTEGDRHVA